MFAIALTVCTLAASAAVPFSNRDGIDTRADLVHTEDAYGHTTNTGLPANHGMVAMKAAMAEVCSHIKCTHEEHKGNCGGGRQFSLDTNTAYFQGAACPTFAKPTSSIRVQHVCSGGLKKSGGRDCAETNCKGGHFCSMDGNNGCVCVALQPMFNAVTAVTVDLPDETVASFNAKKQLAFKKALAASLMVNSEDITLTVRTAGTGRRLASGILVDVKISRKATAADSKQVLTTLQAGNFNEVLTNALVAESVSMKVEVLVLSVKEMSEDEYCLANPKTAGCRTFTKTAGGGMMTNAAGQNPDNFSKNGMTVTSCTQACNSLASTTCHGFSLSPAGRCALWVADHTKEEPAGFEKYNTDYGQSVQGPFCSGDENGTWDLYTRDSICPRPDTFTKHAGGGWLTDSADRNPDNFSKNSMTASQCSSACHTLASTTCHGFSLSPVGRCALWVTDHTKAAPVGFSTYNSDSNNPSTGVFCSGNGNGWDLYTRSSICKAPTGTFTRHAVGGWLTDANGQVPDNISKNAMTLAACEAECHNMKATTCHGFSLSAAGRCAVWVNDHAKAARATWSAYNSDGNKLLSGPFCSGNANGWVMYTKASTCVVR